MKKTTIIGGVVVLVLLVVGVWLFNKDSDSVGEGGQSSATLDTTDTVSTFYDAWLLALKQPATADPSRADLAKSPLLSKALSARLVSAPNATPDPVLCQKVVPENISTRTVYENKDEAQILVMSRDKKVTEQAVVTLSKSNDGWLIDEIECSLGEIAPVREFSFEKEGFLIKTSVPKPYNNKNWHLVFEENGKLGNVVPLFFDASSQCTSLDGTKAVCKPDQFMEAAKVSVHAQMSERGATVKKMEFVK
ncbi:MAG: hypothetical protein WAW81_02020 [Minisyncoccia bacterium]